MIYGTVFMIGKIPGLSMPLYTNRSTELFNNRIVSQIIGSKNQLSILNNQLFLIVGYLFKNIGSASTIMMAELNSAIINIIGANDPVVSHSLL
ncbi:hypothetical protein [Mucilaginibacter gilvus]|uniref:Uncharacterized protein n=1 Tax=Mucilaginibacter gilvus TaxID=2305909 RepID=A0A3S3XCQ6_9SPHI|nr:hypothetical protein [Mucilaginibacter gilvus]RWY55505.1 hypothetical protein EPL05_03775 [Mucilaginibacter gilvus]